MVSDRGYFLSGLGGVLRTICFLAFPAWNSLHFFTKYLYFEDNFFQKALDEISFFCYTGL